jgi:tetratricopeptide (TPR) repeat protein
MKKIIGLVILLTVQFLDNGNLIFTQDSSYESDLEYILTKYYILEDYEEAVRLLNKYYFNYQNELSYLYGLCYLRLNMNKMAIHYLNIALTEHENNYEILGRYGEHGF